MQMLQMVKFKHYKQCIFLDRRHLGKIQINLVFRLICIIFAL